MRRNTSRLGTWDCRNAKVRIQLHNSPRSIISPETSDDHDSGTRHLESFRKFKSLRNNEHLKWGNRIFPEPETESSSLSDFWCLNLRNVGLSLIGQFLPLYATPLALVLRRPPRPWTISGDTWHGKVRLRCSVPSGAGMHAPQLPICCRDNLAVFVFWPSSLRK
jgi:hypothetical protein